MAPITIPIASGGSHGWSPDSTWLSYDKTPPPGTSLLFHVPSAKHLPPFQTAIPAPVALEWTSSADVFAARLGQSGSKTVRARFIQSGALGSEVAFEAPQVASELAWQPLPPPP